MTTSLLAQWDTSGKWGNQMVLLFLLFSFFNRFLLSSTLLSVSLPVSPLPFHPVVPSFKVILYTLCPCICTLYIKYAIRFASVMKKDVQLIYLNK